MKIKLTLLMLTLLLGQFTIEAKNLQARFAYATFSAPGKGPYIETYLNINGHSVSYAPAGNGKFQSSVEVSMVFSQDKAIKTFDKYNILGPEITDTVNGTAHFTDQHRISVPNGNYSMELTIRDKNNPTAKPYSLVQNVVISYEANVVMVSDIELLDTFKKTEKETALSRSGYDLVPLVDNFYSEERNNLRFYAEVYNTSSVVGDAGYLLTYHIETAESHQINPDFVKNMRQTGKPVDIILADMDITNLPSGNYHLVINARNRNNDILATRELFFQRSKGAPVADVNADPSSVDITNTFAARITDKTEMVENIRSLWPISSPNENTWAMNQLQLSDQKVMQQYFYAFWQRRNPSNPEEAWNAYKQKVAFVNSKFSSGKKKGYLTERGRVYLQYGQPNQVSENYNEPNSYPYEIWQYYQLKDQSNKKFVFYNPELGTNDFRLLHSDAKGEISEPQWQVILRSRTESMNDIDRTSPNQRDNTQVDQLFTNPR